MYLILLENRAEYIFSCKSPSEGCSIRKEVPMNRKKLPVGYDSFEEIRRGDFYYIDKTLFIKNLLSNAGKVNLFTRPRRFGQSRNMSMLKSLFEIGSE